MPLSLSLSLSSSGLYFRCCPYSCLVPTRRLLIFSLSSYFPLIHAPSLTLLCFSVFLRLLLLPASSPLFSLISPTTIISLSHSFVLILRLSLLGVRITHHLTLSLRLTLFLQFSLSVWFLPRKPSTSSLLFFRSLAFFEIQKEKRSRESNHPCGNRWKPRSFSLYSAHFPKPSPTALGTELDYREILSVFSSSEFSSSRSFRFIFLCVCAFFHYTWNHRKACIQSSTDQS